MPQEVGRFFVAVAGWFGNVRAWMILNAVAWPHIPTLSDTSNINRNDMGSYLGPFIIASCSFALLASG